MTTSPKVQCFTVVIEAPAEAVFDTVRDLGKLPLWSIHFCRGIRLEDDHAWVDSPAGEVYFAIESDARTGTLDWWSGPTKSEATRWPTRVTALDPGTSLYQVTGIFPADAPEIPGVEQMFADELGALKRLVEGSLVEAASV